MSEVADADWQELSECAEFDGRQFVTLDGLDITVSSVHAHLILLEIRVAEILKELDALRAADAENRWQLELIDAKLDRILGATRP